MITWALAAALAAGGTPPAPGLSPETPPAVAVHVIPAHVDAIPGPGDILAIPPELRAWFHEAVVSRGSTPHRRLELMMSFVFGEDGLGMGYDADATHTVEESWRTRKANCLGFTLLTLALAREAGLDAYAQYIDEVLSWHQQDSNVVQSNHANLGIRIHQSLYTVDVASDVVLARTLPTKLPDEQLIALYYSNRAMEQVMAGDIKAARPYIERALELAPGFADIWNNAGVIHLRNGDAAAAEAAYTRALDIDPRHTGALFNLARVYERRGMTAKAGKLHRRIESVLRNNPFHHFVKGTEAENAGDFAMAVQHYRRAIRLHGGEHRFHYALARACARLGRLEEARDALVEAIRLGGNRDRDLYQAKLDALGARGLAPHPGASGRRRPPGIQ